MREGDRDPAAEKPPPRLGPRGPPGSGAPRQPRHPAAAQAEWKSEPARGAGGDPLTRAGEAASLAQANILAGGRRPRGHDPASLRRERKGERAAAAAMGADAAAGAYPLRLPLLRADGLSAAERGCAQARRDRRRAPGCGATEEEGAAPRSLYADAIGSGGGREPRHAPRLTTPHL